MSDSQIARAIRLLLAALLDDMDAVQIDVEQGVVYLEGIAVSATQKEKIDQIVSQVPGVQQVVNCLSLEHIARWPPADSPAMILPPLAPADFHWTSSETFGPN